MKMGVLVRLSGEVQWSRTSSQHMADSAGSAKNHSARKHKYKLFLGLPSTVGNVEHVYRMSEAIASRDGPPTCVSVEDAADYDVEGGTSASAGVGWEGRVMRWAVLSRCTRAEVGTVDLTSTLPRYNSSGSIKLGTLPRDGTLLLLQYTRPRNIDPYAQLKGFKRCAAVPRIACAGACASPVQPCASRELTPRHDPHEGKAALPSQAAWTWPRRMLCHDCLHPRVCSLPCLLGTRV
jgi:hypothetical protein